MIIWLLIMAIVVIIYDYLTKLKKARRRDQAVYFTLMGVGFVLLFLSCRNVSLSAPVQAVMKVIDAVFHIND